MISEPGTTLTRPSLAMTLIVVVAYRWSGGLPSHVAWWPPRHACSRPPGCRCADQPGKRLGDWLYFLLAIPVVAMAPSDWGIPGRPANFHGARRFTQLSNAYLLCLAIQETYRAAPVPARLVVVHMANSGACCSTPGLSYDAGCATLILCDGACTWRCCGGCGKPPCRPPGRRAPSAAAAANGSSALAPVSVAVSGGRVGGRLSPLPAPVAEFQIGDIYLLHRQRHGPNSMGPVCEILSWAASARMFNSNSVMARWFGPNPVNICGVGVHDRRTTQNRWVTSEGEDTGPPAHSIVLVTDPIETPLKATAAGPIFHYPVAPPTTPSLVGSVLEDGFGGILAPYGTWAVSTGNTQRRGCAADPEVIILGSSSGGVSSFEAPLAWSDTTPEDLSGQRRHDPGLLRTCRPELQEESRRLAGFAIVWGRSDAARRGLGAGHPETWLQATCTYTRIAHSEPSRDPIGITLRSAPIRGHCEYFATGDGAYIAVFPGDPLPLRAGLHGAGKEHASKWLLGTFLPADAHAWLEVYVPHRGWMRWDPTPPAEEQERELESASTSWTASASGSVRAVFSLFGPAWPAATGSSSCIDVWPPRDLLVRGGPLLWPMASCALAGYGCSRRSPPVLELPRAGHPRDDTGPWPRWKKP